MPAVVAYHIVSLATHLGRTVEIAHQPDMRIFFHLCLRSLPLPLKGFLRIIPPAVMHAEEPFLRCGFCTDAEDFASLPVAVIIYRTCLNDFCFEDGAAAHECNTLIVFVIAFFQWQPCPEIADTSIFQHLCHTVYVVVLPNGNALCTGDVSLCSFDGHFCNGLIHFLQCNHIGLFLRYHLHESLQFFVIVFFHKAVGIECE